MPFSRFFIPFLAQNSASQANQSWLRNGTNGDSDTSAVDGCEIQSGQAEGARDRAGALGHGRILQEMCARGGSGSGAELESRSDIFAAKRRNLQGSGCGVQCPSVVS